MLECSITDGGVEVALVRMRPSGSPKMNGELQDYLVEFIIDKGDSFGAYNRFVHDWPTNSSNPLALVKAALALVDTGVTAIEGDYDVGRVPPDLARQIGRTVPAIQTGQSELHHHGPPIRSEQPEQHGRHSLREGARPEDRE